MKIFIADDASFIRERLISMLSELEELEVIGQTEEAQEAVDSILKLKPEVVVLDICLRGGSGIEVLHQIKQADPAPTVIMLTNYSYSQYREKCLKTGADFFFDKSTEFEQVREALRELIRRGAAPPSSREAQ